MTINVNEWLGTFRGSDMRSEQLDALLAFSLQPQDIEAARALHETKWWDYRFIHPGYGFFLYAHEFGLASTRWRSMFGVPHHVELQAQEHPLWRPEYERHGRTRVFKKNAMTPPGYRTSMWRGMCFADGYGIPYDRWIAFAFEYAFDSKWERMPQPSGLYSDQMVAYIVDHWTRERDDIMRLPTDPRYLVANDEGHRWQTAQHEWLIELIRRRPLPHIPLAQYLFREKRIPEHLAIQRLGEDVVDRARISASAY